MGPSIGSVSHTLIHRASSRAFWTIRSEVTFRSRLSIAQNPSSELNPDGSLQIMYGIDGRHELKEETLDHLEGYRRSRPVRIGNRAYNQLQLDIYGELMDSWTRFISTTRQRFWTRAGATRHLRLSNLRWIPGVGKAYLSISEQEKTCPSRYRGVRSFPKTSHNNSRD